MNEKKLTPNPAPGNISREEARASLDAIRSAGDRTRRALKIGPAPILLWTWGGVWFIGYLATYLLLRAQHYGLITSIWYGLVLAGVAVSVTVSVRVPIRSPQSRLIGLMWLVTILFGALWAAMLSPSDYQANAFITTLCMFAWILTGLLARNTIWVALGLTGAALIAAGYWWLAPSYVFWLWMALAGGGMMLFAGTYLAVRERRRG